MHLCRVDLTVAVYGGVPLQKRQHLWPSAWTALCKGKRARENALTHLRPKVVALETMLKFPRPPSTVALF
jgi:hypothetical protein